MPTDLTQSYVLSIQKIEDEAADLRKQVAELKTVVKHVEGYIDREGWMRCLWCREILPNHAPDCIRQKALGLI